MSNTSLTTTDSPLDPNQVIKDFETILVDNNHDGKNRPVGPLWYAWHYLQVYSFWGLHLPNTENELKLALRITDPAAYDFFPSMLETYKRIHGASDDFLNRIFPQVIELGNDLKSFAKQATSHTADGGAVFSVITDFLDGKDGTIDDAITLLTDLQTSATANAAKAAEVNALLATYKSSLVDAQGKLKRVQEGIEADKKTSQAKIDELESTAPGAAGSLANMKKLIKDERAERDHDVVVAATSPTYVWVFPVGTISAIVVATVYGVRAVQMLDEINAMQAKIDAAEATLRTAHKSRAVQQLAGEGVSSASKHTDLAITHTTTVQNAWNGLSTQLEIIKNKLDSMTKETDQGKVLQSKAIIKVYLKAADAAWGALVPPLAQLTANPYINAKVGETVSFGDIAAEVKRLVAGQNGTQN